MENQMPVSEITISQPPISPQFNPDSAPQPKKSIILPIFISILVLGLIISVTYLSLQTRSLRAQLNTSLSPAPSSIPQPSADPTANWESYSNPKAIFTFKYPPEIGIENDCIGNSQCTGSFINLKYLNIEQFTSNSTCENIKLASWSSPVEISTIMVGGIESLLISTNNLETETDGQQILRVVCVPINDNSIKIQYNSSVTNTNSNIFDQILSTFHFTDQTQKNGEVVFGMKYSNTVVAFEPPLSNTDREAVRKELTKEVVEPFIDFNDEVYGIGSVVSLLVSLNNSNEFPYKIIGINKTGGQNYELLNKTDDGFWWTPTCMGVCPVSPNFHQKYPKIMKQVE